MAFDLFLTGGVVGLSIAMPIGPIDILCIRNSLAWGRRYGFATGMGAAFADAIYGAIAGFGVVALTTLLIEHIFWFKIIGGIFLCYLGIHTLRAKTYLSSVKVGKATMLRAFLTTFFIAMANPLTVLSIIGIYTAFGLGVGDISPKGIAMLTAGIFLGSTLWWFVLSFAARLLKNRFNDEYLLWLNRASGSILLIFGIAALLI